jgi:hypothetical protein
VPIGIASAICRTAGGLAVLGLRVHGADVLGRFVIVLGRLVAADVSANVLSTMTDYFGWWNLMQHSSQLGPSPAIDERFDPSVFGPFSMIIRL